MDVGIYIYLYSICLYACLILYKEDGVLVCLCNIWCQHLGMCIHDQTCWSSSCSHIYCRHDHVCIECISFCRSICQSHFLEKCWSFSTIVLPYVATVTLSHSPSSQPIHIPIISHDLQKISPDIIPLYAIFSPDHSHSTTIFSLGKLSGTPSSSPFQRGYMEVSINEGTPKQMVHNGKTYQNGWLGVTTVFENPHIGNMDTHSYRSLNSPLDRAKVLPLSMP